jgi:GT2 family glycosyltransferase
MYKIGVVIPFYGGNVYLPKLLSSILTGSGEFSRVIIIVDNSKADAKAELILSYGKEVEIIDAGEGIGFGKACNIGFNRCVEMGCDFLVVVNQDGYFAPGAFQKLLNVLIDNEHLSVTVPVLTRYETDEVEWFFTYVYLTPLTALVSDLFRKKIQQYYQTEKLCGACFAMRLSHYLPFSYLFDDLYHMYFEDEDLNERLKKMNRSVFLIPDAVFHHTHGNTTNWDHEPLSAKVTRRVSQLIFYLKHSKRSLIHNFLGWMMLEIRVMVEYFFSFRWRRVLIEFISFCIVVGKIHKIVRKKKMEKIILTNL